MFITRALIISSFSLATGCMVGDATNGTAAADLSASTCPAGTPASLAPATDRDLSFTLDARGTQNYQCAASGTGYAWKFIAPDALLYKDDEVVGHHFAGPTWQYEDGSEIVGSKLAAATVDPTAVPWLLLDVVSHDGPSDGKFATIFSVQRLETVGGNAPATGCDATHVNATVNVPYTATYFFYRMKAANASNVRCGA